MLKKFKNGLEIFVEIPESVEISVDRGSIVVKGNGKELKRKFDLRGAVMKVAEGKLKISVDKAIKRKVKMMRTVEAHIKNMIKGVKEDFVYKLEICNVHFPMNVKVEGDKVVIKSFLGETIPRTARILPDVEVKVKGNEIEVKSANVEAAGQTAANIEKATRLKGRDRRVFQDGIFIKEKSGREI